MHIVWDIYVIKLDIPLSFLQWIPDVLPVFHNHPALLKCQHFEQTLDLFSKFSINQYIDHYAFKLVT